MSDKEELDRLPRNLNDQHCSNQVKRKKLVRVNEKNGKRILAEVTNRKEDKKLTTLEPENTSQKIDIWEVL